MRTDEDAAGVHPFPFAVGGMMVSERLVTKATFLDAIPCMARGWHTQNSPPAVPSLGARFRMAEGQEVHGLARRAFADGVFGGSPEQTAKHITQARTVFEAAFEVQGYAARADILERCGTGFRLLEVKSSLHDEGKVKPEHIDDLAYTTMVLLRSGVNLKGAELLLISRVWQFGMPFSELFVRSDHTAAAFERAAEFSELWDGVKDAVSQDHVPDSTLTFECRNCAYFEATCLGVGLEDPVFDLPRLSKSKFDALNEVGIFSIGEVPPAFELTGNQRRVWEGVRTGQPFVDVAELEKQLSSVKWPAGYLDFETVKLAVPVWPGVAPHEQVVTQYSLHVRAGPVDEPHHRWFLADASTDDRLRLTERLLADVAGLESIIVYSSFEKTMIGYLSRLFPDLAEPLTRVSDRFFDLEAPFKRAYYHPAFRGRSSIKSTLPVLVPGMDYESLPISSGEEAIAAFARMAKGECQGDQEIEELRGNLMAYCALDTLAMVKLHDALRSHLQ